MNKLDLTKLVNTIIYFCDNTNSNTLSKTKILKLLFLSDFKHIEKYGRPITFDEYYHLPMGPVPTLTKNFLDNMTGTKDIDLGREIELFVNAFKLEPKHAFDYEYTVIKKKDSVKFNQSKFSRSEIDILKSICKKYYNTTARKLIEITHRHKGFKSTCENEKIDYRFGIKDINDLNYYNYWKKENDSFDIFLKDLKRKKDKKNVPCENQFNADLASIKI